MVVVAIVVVVFDVVVVLLVVFDVLVAAR